MSERREETEQLSAEQLLDELAIQDEAEATPGLQSVADADSTLKSLKAELDTLASQVREPAPVVPFEDESDCRRVTELVEVLGLEPSLAGHTPNDAGLPDPEPLGELGQYLLLSKLGQGGMGTVYKALHTRLDKIVAIKLLPEQKTSDTHAVARFEQEMRAVGKLEHANIVRAMDANEHEETHYLVMEYVDGVDLSDLVRRVGPLPVADACELVRQAAIGLQHAHEHSLVHRDIKPSNLMLTRQGQLKILDLGLARLHNGNHGELTSTGQMMGTIDYMAPEQTGNSHNVDIRADIYGLGATLFKLLCDRAPYADERHDTVIKKLNALATQPVPSIQDRRQEVPEVLAAIVTKMLAKEAGGRYATPQEVAEALTPFCSGHDLTLLLKNATAKDTKPAVDQSAVGTQDSLKSGSVETDPTIDMQSSPHAPREESVGPVRQPGPDELARTESIQSPTGPSGPTDGAAIGEGLPTSPKPPTEGLQEADAGQGKGRPAVKQAARSGDLAKTRSGDLATTASSQPWYTNRRNQIITVAAALGGILLFAAITLFFQTKDGTIVVEIDDPEGLIQVTVDGEDIVITDKNAGEPIRLKPGDHKLNVTRAGLEFTTDRFTLKRGNKVVLSVKLVDGEVRVIEKNDAETILGRGRLDKELIQTAASVTTWQLGPSENVLPGIVPRPAKLPGIKRWQLETTAPRTQVKCVDWTNDGQFIAAGSDTGMIRIFDATTLECRQILPGTLCNSVAWSSDAKRVVATGTFDVDGTTCPAAICNPDGQSIALKREGILEGAHAAVWSPDDSKVAIAGYWMNSRGYVGKISIWGSDGEFIRFFDCDPASDVAWSPDGELIAGGSESGKVTIWTVEGEPVADVQAYKGGTLVSWSPDSQWLATVGYDPEPKVKLWKRDGTAGPEYRPEDSHRHNLYEPAWSPDGGRLAIAGVGGIHILNAEGVFQKFLRGDATNYFAVVWSPDGSRVLSGGGEGLTVKDVDGEQRNELVRRFAPCQVAWSPRSDRLAISALPMSTYGTNAHLLQPNGGFDKAIDRQFAAGRPEWSPDGKRIVLGSLHTPTGVILSSGPQDSELEQLAQMSPAAYTVWNPQGTELASVYYRDSESVIRIWDRDGQALSTIPIPSKAGQVAWHPDGKLLAVGTASEIFLVHRDGKIEKTVEDQGSYYDLAWSPDGDWLAASGASMTRLIRRDGTLGPFLSQNGLAVAWSPDSRQVAVGTVGRTVQIWNVEGKLLRSLIGHDGNVESVSWSSDGKYLTSASGGTVINWNATTWEPEWTHVLLGNDQTATFTAAGQIINGTPDLIEERFVYLVENEDGRLETLKPSEFQQIINQRLRYESSPPQRDDSPDRRVAESIISIDGKVSVAGTGSVLIDNVDDLPAGPIQLSIVDLRGNQNVTGAHLAQLKQLKSNYALYLSESAISDEDLKQLPRAINQLYLGGTAISHAGLAHLSQSRFIQLHLDTAQFTPEAAAKLSQFDEPPVQLGIRSKDSELLSAELIRRVGSLKRVTHLTLGYNRLSADAWAELSQLAHLTSIVLEQTGITDAELKSFSSLSKLEDLHLSYNNISDDGLKHLSTMTTLVLLVVPGTKVTEAGVTALSKALPNCRIKWDGGVIEPTGGDIDREVAEWVLSVGGWVGLSAVGSDELFAATTWDGTPIMNPEQLPEDLSFRVTGINLASDHVVDQIDDADLKRLAKLESLMALNLEGQPITDAGLSQLAHMHTLKGIKLGGTKVKNPGLHLSKMPLLEFLELHGTEITDVGFEQFNENLNLSRLYLHNTSIGDGTLEALKKFPNLEKLHMANTRCTAVGLTHLPALKKLADLSVNMNDVGDEGALSIGKLRSLLALNMDQTGITDAGLAHLRNLTSLRKLYLSRNQLSGEAITALSKALANCRIEWDGGVIEPTGDPQRAAAEWIIEKGGALAIDTGTAFESGDTLPDSPLKVTSVRLEGPDVEVTEEEFRRLRPLVDLELLSLVSSKTDGAGLKHLAGLRKLRVFIPASTQVNDTVIAELPDWPLFYVDLNRTSTSDTSIAALKRFTGLERLGTGRGVTDEGFRQLVNFAALRYLSIGEENPNVSDRTAEAIAHATQLTHLNWVRSPLTDDGLKHLASLTKLRELHLKHSKVTEAGVTALSKALPNCRIEWDGAVIEPKVDLHRRAAEWVIERGGTGYVLSTKGAGIQFAKLEDLPKEDFKLTAVYFAYAVEDLKDDELEILREIDTLSTVSLNANRALTDAVLESLIASRTTLVSLQLGRLPITDAGAARLAEFYRLTQLDLGGSKITDEGIRHLRRLPDLQSLSLPDTAITDASAGHLATISTLTYLLISNTKLTDAGLAKLAQLPRLQTLDINEIVTDKSLEAFSQVGTLELLDFGGRNFTDAGLVHLARYPKLLGLNLHPSSNLSDDGLKHLAAIKGLKRLTITTDVNTDPDQIITDAGFAHIGKLQGLEFLSLYVDTLTDDSLERFHGMKKLQDLWLNRCPKVTVDGIAKLMLALPECAIQSYDADVQKKIDSAKEMLKKDSKEE